MSRYYIMEGTAESSIVLLGSLPDTSDLSDGWMLGRKLLGRITEPIKIFAIEDFEEGTLMPLYKSIPIMRNDLYETIISAGVNNIQTWHTTIHGSDGTVLRDDYKAFNIIGLVSGARPATVFARENPSR